MLCENYWSQGIGRIYWKDLCIQFSEQKYSRHFSKFKKKPYSSDQTYENKEITPKGEDKQKDEWFSCPLRKKNQQ